MTREPLDREPLSPLLNALRLEQMDDGDYLAPPMTDASGVAYGGLILAQAIVATNAAAGDKQVKTIHAAFTRPARADEPITIALEPISNGRTFGSLAVRLSQNQKVVTQCMVLLSASEPDVIRHADSAPALDAPPADPPSGAHGLEGWKIVTAGGVDLDDAAIGPPELDLWTRFAGAPDDPALNQALLGYATDGFLIGTALRPHAGLSQSDAHTTLATGVVTHTLTFHEAVLAREWLLLSQRSTYAGAGRAYGRGDVFTAAGRLVASFAQDALIRQLS